MIKRIIQILPLLLISLGVQAQDAETDSSSQFLRRIFLPSVDVGYQVNNVDLIGNSVKFSTSIEYRIRNNNHFFFRLNYDTWRPIQVDECK